MAVLYDLVIISSTGLGRQVAMKAAAMKARIALVEIHPPTEYWLAMAAIYQPIIPEAIAPEARSRWLRTAVAHLDELDSPAVLAAFGIDVMHGAGEFSCLPRFGFALSNRFLTARSYLIIPSDRTIYPEIPELEGILVHTKENLQHKIFSLAPHKRWLVIGGNATGVEFAQLLHRLGAKVTLAIEGDRILPQEDPDIANLLQASLEAEGIEIIPQSPVEAIRNIDGSKWVQAGNRAIETDEIFLAIRQYPRIEGLNLEGVGVKFNRGGIEVNSKLQTANPRIYACSSHQPALAAREAEIALYNALFFPNRSIDRHQIPIVVQTQPPLARIGLTPAQARSVRGEEILVLREYFKHLSAAQISGDLTGMCQLIVRSNGEILGAQILGRGATELGEAIALQMQNRVKIQHLAKLAGIYPSYTEFFVRLAQIWQEKNLHSRQWQAELLDKFFDWRRAWTK